MPFENVRVPLAPGIVIVLPELNRSIQVPQLTFGQRDDNEALLDRFAETKGAYPADATREQKKAQDKEISDVLREIVVLALSRNYPSVEIKDVRDLTPHDMKRAVGYALMGPDSGESPAAPSNLPPMNGKLVAAVIN